MESLERSPLGCRHSDDSCTLTARSLFVVFSTTRVVLTEECLAFVAQRGTMIHERTMMMEDLSGKLCYYR